MSADLSTRYLGLSLRTPLVLAACPLGGSMNALQRLEEAGVGAVVLPSLFEEQVRRDRVLLEGLGPDAPGWGTGWGDYFERLDDYNSGEVAYLKYLEDAKQVLSVPVIASLNGATPGGWVDCAHRLQNAGADALELNVYHLAHEMHVTGAEVEDRLLEVVSAVRARVTIPLAVKLGPQFSSLPNLVASLDGRRVDGVVLFNRFLQPDLDLETLELRPSILLSTPQEIRLPLTWIAILRDQTPISLAASGGVSTSKDALKLLLVGADAIQIAAAILRHGPSRVRTILDGLSAWGAHPRPPTGDPHRGIRSRDRSSHPEMYGRVDYTRVVAGSDRPGLVPAGESPP